MRRFHPGVCVATGVFESAQSRLRPVWLGVEQLAVPFQKIIRGWFEQTIRTDFASASLLREPPLRSLAMPIDTKMAGGKLSDKTIVL
jgi:hypothetical protein